MTNKSCSAGKAGATSLKIITDPACWGEGLCVE